MFIDKDRLLSKLNKLYETCMPCCVSLYSYPGEGRSRLLQEFLKGKKGLFYKASCAPWQENFRLLRDLCLRELGEDFAQAARTSGLIKALKKRTPTRFCFIFFFEEIFFFRLERLLFP